MRYTFAFLLPFASIAVALPLDSHDAIATGATVHNANAQGATVHYANATGATGHTNKNKGTSEKVAIAQVEVITYLRSIYP